MRSSRGDDPPGRPGAGTPRAACARDLRAPRRRRADLLRGGAVGGRDGAAHRRPLADPSVARGRGRRRGRRVRLRLPPRGARRVPVGGGRGRLRPPGPPPARDRAPALHRDPRGLPRAGLPAGVRGDHAPERRERRLPRGARVRPGRGLPPPGMEGRRLAGRGLVGGSTSHPARPTRRPSRRPPLRRNATPPGSPRASGRRVGGGHGSGRADIRGGPMAYGIVHFFPGGTQEQYEASIAAVHPDAAAASPRARSSTRPARRRAAGRSWRSTTPGRAGRRSATRS